MKGDRIVGETPGLPIYAQELLAEKYCDWVNMDLYLRYHVEQVNHLINISHWDAYREKFNTLSIPSQQTIKLELEDCVRIVLQSDSSSACYEKKELLQELITELIPWRKGPFEIFGEVIDAEWRSHLKWERLLPSLKDLGGARIADVGCNNGYYMFRAAKHQPELTIGFDPNGIFYHQFQLLQSFAQIPNLYFEPLGVQHLDAFPKFFDVIFFMGVIYHRKDPYESLRVLKHSLAPGGQIVFESLAIPGDEPYALCPEGRYAKMKNVWFIPTEGCMRNWLQKVGFRDISMISSTAVRPEEQRSTRLAPFESLSDYLDPEDDSKTVEGYPAPRRVIYTGRV